MNGISCCTSWESKTGLRSQKIRYPECGVSWSGALGLPDCNILPYGLQLGLTRQSCLSPKQMLPAGVARQLIDRTPTLEGTHWSTLSAVSSPNVQRRSIN